MQAEWYKLNLFAFILVTLLIILRVPFSGAYLVGRMFFVIMLTTITFCRIVYVLFIRMGYVGMHQNSYTEL